MNVLLTALLLLGFSLVLVLGLLSVVQDLLERSFHDEPVFQDQAPVVNHPDADRPEVRSQFAWQSRSHFRAPD